MTILVYINKLSYNSKMPKGIYIRTKKHNKNISLNRLDNKNPNWKGNKVGYTALHGYINRNYKKPLLCENCKKVKPYDLANKGIYDRNIKNWEWLCRRCHMIKDGRIKNLYQFTGKIAYWKNKKLPKYIINKMKISCKNRKRDNLGHFISI